MKDFIHKTSKKETKFTQKAKEYPNSRRSSTMVKRKKQVDITGFTKASALLHQEKKVDKKSTPNKSTPDENDPKLEKIDPSGGPPNKISTAVTHNSLNDTAAHFDNEEHALETDTQRIDLDHSLNTTNSTNSGNNDAGTATISKNTIILDNELSMVINNTNDAINKSDISTSSNNTSKTKTKQSKNN